MTINDDPKNVLDIGGGERIEKGSQAGRERCSMAMSDDPVRLSGLSSHFSYVDFSGSSCSYRRPVPVNHQRWPFFKRNTIGKSFASASNIF